MILLASLTQAAFFGVIAYLVLAWLLNSTVGIIAALILGATRLRSGFWAVGRGATTCHACHNTFTTR